MAETGYGRERLVRFQDQGVADLAGAKDRNHREGPKQPVQAVEMPVAVDHLTPVYLENPPSDGGFSR
jgi:hypothetical protein